MKSGIYQIICKANNKRYIGSSIDLFKRKSTHFNELRSGIHDNKYLQNAYNKHGKGSFEFKILCYYEPTELLFQEQRFLDYYWETASLFNICETAGSCFGKKVSEEAKQKISKANTGKKHSEETKKKIIKSLTGKKHSDETRKKISETGKGMKRKPFSEIAKGNMSIAAKKRSHNRDGSTGKFSKGELVSR